MNLSLKCPYGLTRVLKKTIHKLPKFYKNTIKLVKSAIFKTQKMSFPEDIRINQILRFQDLENTKKCSPAKTSTFNVE